MIDVAPTRRGRRLVPALVCAAALLLGGCTASPTAKPAPPASSEQPATTPARVPLGRQNFAKRMTDAQLRAGAAHLVMKLETYDYTQRAKGDLTVRANPKKRRMQFTTTMRKVKAQYRFVDGDLYLATGTLNGKFVKLRGDEAPGLDMMLALTHQLDPVVQLRTQQKAIKTFQVFPDATTIDGESVDRIFMTLDMKTMLKSNRMLKVLAPRKGAIRALGGAMTYSMFVDRHDLLRRVVIAPGGVTLTVDYSAWGKPVSIKKPAGSKLLDPSQVVWK